MRVKNISSRVYGADPSTTCSVKFTTDPRMPPNMVKIASSRAGAQVQDPITWELAVENLKPDETREFKGMPKYGYILLSLATTDVASKCASR